MCSIEGNSERDRQAGKCQSMAAVYVDVHAVGICFFISLALWLQASVS